MSFIPPTCNACGDALRRITNKDSTLICVNNGCKQKFTLMRVTNVTNIEKGGD